MLRIARPFARDQPCGRRLPRAEAGSSAAQCTIRQTHVEAPSNLQAAHLNSEAASNRSEHQEENQMSQSAKVEFLALTSLARQTAPPARSEAEKPRLLKRSCFSLVRIWLRRGDAEFDRSGGRGPDQKGGRRRQVQGQGVDRARHHRAGGLQPPTGCSSSEPAPQVKKRQNPARARNATKRRSLTII